MIAVAALPTGVGSTPSPKRIGTVVAGRYRLERELGAGGMGDVFVAVQEPLGREVALKLMRAGLTGPAAQRFEREARSLATMSHPNIVTIYDYGRTDDGELFMAMELVRGLTLRQQLAHAGRLSPRATMAVLVDVCRALAATHAAGIVHRDLKPENVMLVDDGNNTSTAKVLDFGIARLHDPDGADDAPRLTQTGHLVGTPGYMAPETVLEAVFDDPRSDLYALGVIAWELLTDRTLFSAPTPIALVMKHALDPPPTLAATLGLTTSPHPALESLLAMLLHKDRHQRFASATAVIEAINALPPAALLPLEDHSSARKMIVNSDPSAATIDATRQGLQLPKAPLSSSSLPSSLLPSSTPLTMAVATSASSASLSPSSSSSRTPLLAGLVLLVLVLAAMLSFVVIRQRAVQAPDVVVPAVVIAPAVVAPAVVAPAVVAPVPAAPGRSPNVHVPNAPAVRRAIDRVVRETIFAPPPPRSPRKPKRPRASPPTDHVPDLN